MNKIEYNTQSKLKQIEKDFAKKIKQNFLKKIKDCYYKMEAEIEENQKQDTKTEVILIGNNII